jgi:cytochrome c553
MKLSRLNLAILAIVSSSVASLAGDWETVSFGQTLADRNCTWCHGASGQGFATAPLLAGQRPQYIENQLLSFHNHTRDNPLSQQYMWGAAAKLSPQEAHDLAAYFSMLEPEAANDGDKDLAVRGGDLFHSGDPETNVPSCAFCHGPNAEGVRDIPRLGGLAYHYLKRRLEQWGEGYHEAAAAPMPEIASKLSKDQIEALASYLSFVK